MQPLFNTVRNAWRRAVRTAWPLLLPLLLLFGAPARAENVYIMDIGLRGIYSVDVNSGGPQTLLTSITPPATPQGYTLATRPSDGMLFYLDSNTANPNLWRWDPGNPTSPPVLVGTPGATTTGVVRLGFNAAGELLAMDTTSNMWKLDTNTGGIVSTTPLSGSLPSQSGDLCLNTTTGVLYMVANTEVYTVSTFGVSTLLGTVTGLPAAATVLVTGCAFTANGTMLISMYSGGALLRVNLGTLVATALPNSTNIASIGDLATAPERSADMSLTNTASNITPGTTVSFTVTVSNAGPSRANDVRVQDLLPAGLTLTSATPSQGAYSAAAAGSNPAGTWSLGTVPVGGTATLTLLATVPAGTGSVINTAEIIYSDQYDPDSTPNNHVAGEDDQASVTITGSPDLQVSKVASGSFAVGINGSYSITVNNIGSAATAGTYTVTDVLPAGLSFVSATGTGWACGNAAGTVTCSNSTVIAAGASNPNAVTLTVLPAAAAAPTVTNAASVAGGGEPASNNGNNTSSVTTAVCNSNCPDLKVNKTLSTGSLTVGTVATYTLSVTNIGGLTTGASSYTVTDTLPAGLTLNAAPTAGVGWTCTASAPTTNVANGTIVSCTRATALTPGSTSTTVTFPVNVANTAVPQVVNTATVSGGGEPLATQGNNSTSLTTPVLDFDLTISKSKSGAGNFSVGTNSSYTFTISNIGAKASSGNITFTDILPAGLTILNTSATGWTIGAGWTCTQNLNVAGSNTAGGSRITCNSATAIAVGASATTVTVPVAVGAAAAPSVSNTVNVTAANEAPALTGNNAFTLVTAVNAPDLVVTKSHNGTFAVGASGQYTLTVTNVGAVSSAGTITVVDALPVGLTYVSAVGTGWTCNYAAAPRQVTCTNATVLAPSDSDIPIVLTVTPTAAAAAASPVVNTATVSGGNEPAGNSGNNTANDTTYVYYPPVLAKSFSPASIPAGGTSTLQLTITNPAGSTAGALAGLAFNDPFPAGMAVANPPNVVNSCSGTLASGTAQGDTLVSLSGGSTGGAGTSCSISVVVTATGVGSLVNTTGQVSSSNAGTGNTASATLTTTAPGSPVLTKVSSPNPLGLGETGSLVFTITNKASQTVNMGFTDTMPLNVQVAGAATHTCTNNITAPNASVTATVGTRVITVAGVDLAGNANCTITVPIKSTVAGTYVNNSSNITAPAGGLTATTLSDTLVVEAVGLSKTFTPSSVYTNGTSTMALVLTNGPGLAEQNNLAFTETLPSGVTLSAVPTASQCGGTVTGAAGGGTVAVSGATLAAGLASCTVTAVVTATAAGSYPNPAANISGLSANLVNNVTATLVVTLPPGPNLLKTNGTTSVSPGDTTTYVITMSNTSGATYTGGTAAVLRDPAVANLAINTAACAAQGGATCPALASAAMITAFQSAGGLTVPTMPNNSTVVFTVTAQLSGNPAGTLTNVATATSNGGVTTAQDSDTIVYPSLTSTKTVAVTRDPVNGTTNPKNIPGSENLYTITVANSGLGRVDDGSVAIVDRIPPNTSLFVNSLGGSPAGPVTFTDAASNLALTYTAPGSTTDDVDFSSDGGTTWTYVPTPDANGYDAAVTHLRVRPRGRMAGWSGAGPFPAFSLGFQVRLN